MTLHQHLLNLTQVFAAVSDTPRLDAEIILQHVLQQPRSYLYAHDNETLTLTQQQLLTEWQARRLNGEPLAYIIGEKEFWSLVFKVSPAVLVPRPETELIVEWVLQHFGNSKITIADVGTGSGAIAVAIASERPQWDIVASDVSTDALAVAQTNAAMHKTQHITFLQSYLLKDYPSQRFHIIAANLPYIDPSFSPLTKAPLSFEPTLALQAADHGLALIKELILMAPDYLLAGGYLLLEHGYEQAQAIRECLELVGYKSINQIKDLGGLVRVTIAAIV